MIQTLRKIPWPGWEATKVLGGGSFGTVYEIQRRISGSNITEKAALKVIPVPKEASEIQQMLQNGYSVAGLRERFRTDMEQITREYAIMAALKGNANVVYCDDLECLQTEDGIGWNIYIKMELLTPLSNTLTYPISQRSVVKLGMDLCNALSACKKHGIVHRDIKPGNIMVAPDGNYKLGDFGIAKTVERTAGGTKTGTYSYMAPEVYNNRPYGLSVDIYSLGMVMYWMLNERCGPFLPLPPTVPSAMQIEEAKQRRFDGAPLPAPANGCPQLQQIVLKACAFDPEVRYQTPEELYADLAQLNKTLPEEIPTEQSNVFDVVREEAPTIGNSWQDPIREEKSIFAMWEQSAQVASVQEMGEETVEQVQTPEVEASKKKVIYKSKIVFLLLTIYPLTGVLGFHDLYLGRRKVFLRKFYAMNFLVFGWFVDIIKVLLNKYTVPEDVVLR